MKSYGTGDRRHDISKAKVHEVNKHRWKWIELEYTSVIGLRKKKAKDLRVEEGKRLWSDPLEISVIYIPLHRF